MLPCDCGVCGDWLPPEYCKANALPASMIVLNTIAALILFIGLVVSFRMCGQSLCDAQFIPQEGKPALDS